MRGDGRRTLKTGWRASKSTRKCPRPPRRWGGKERWAESRRQAYDADDLEAWLETAPAVHIWFSIVVGKHPEGAEDADGWWSDWAAATRPALTPGLVLSGRVHAPHERHVADVGDAEIFEEGCLPLEQARVFEPLERLAAEFRGPGVHHRITGL